MADREMNVILNLLAYDKPWLALTRNTTLSAEAEQLLTRLLWFLPIFVANLIKFIFKSAQIR